MGNLGTCRRGIVAPLIRLSGAAVFAGCGITSALVQPVQAQTVADKRFVVSNHTPGAIIDFRVLAPGRRWSENWLKIPIPGRGGRNLAFNADRPSNCMMTARVIIDFGSRGMSNERVIEEPVNFCGLAVINVLNDRLRLESDTGAPQYVPRVPNRQAEFEPVSEPYRPGDWVLGRWRNGEHWYPGIVESAARATVTIRYDDGDRETAHVSRVRSYTWSVGTRIECNWKGSGTWHSGRITSLNGDMLNIDYDDADRERTRTGKCRSR